MKKTELKEYIKSRIKEIITVELSKKLTPQEKSLKSTEKTYWRFKRNIQSKNS
jgi:hypothetical protein